MNTTLQLNSLLKGCYNLNESTLDYTTDIHKTNNKRKIYMRNFFILLILFNVLILLTITEGYMKIHEYEEYARTVNNANITTVLGPLMFTGSTYVFIGTCIISFMAKFIKNVDTDLRKILKKLPIFSILFTIPALLVASYIVQIIQLI